MDSEKKTYKTIDEYIKDFPPEIQEKLQEIRAAIQAQAPKAQEKISYGMPAFALNGVLVYFAAFKNHIGFFPTASGVEAFRDELAGYKISKGTIQLPLDKPLPMDLIKRIVQFKVNENLGKKKSK